MFVSVAAMPFLIEVSNHERWMRREYVSWSQAKLWIVSSEIDRRYSTVTEKEVWIRLRNEDLSLRKRSTSTRTISTRIIRGRLS